MEAFIHVIVFILLLASVINCNKNDVISKEFFKYLLKNKSLADVFSKKLLTLIYGSFFPLFFRKMENRKSDIFLRKILG